jgi:hypothetical protein
VARVAGQRGWRQRSSGRRLSRAPPPQKEQRMVAEGHRPTAVPGGERRREALEVGVERERGEERGRSPAGPREREVGGPDCFLEKSWRGRL